MSIGKLLLVYDKVIELSEGNYIIKDNTGYRKVKGAIIGDKIYKTIYSLMDNLYIFQSSSTELELVNENLDILAVGTADEIILHLGNYLDKLDCKELYNRLDNISNEIYLRGKTNNIIEITKQKVDNKLILNIELSYKKAISSLFVNNTRYIPFIDEDTNGHTIEIVNDNISITKSKIENKCRMYYNSDIIYNFNNLSMLYVNMLYKYNMKDIILEGRDTDGFKYLIGVSGTKVYKLESKVNDIFKSKDYIIINIKGDKYKICKISNYNKYEEELYVDYICNSDSNYLFSYKDKDLYRYILTTPYGLHKDIYKSTDIKYFKYCKYYTLNYRITVLKDVEDGTNIISIVDNLFEHIHTVNKNMLNYWNKVYEIEIDNKTIYIGEIINKTYKSEEYVLIDKNGHPELDKTHSSLDRLIGHSNYKIKNIHYK